MTHCPFCSLLCNLEQNNAPNSCQLRKSALSAIQSQVYASDKDAENLAARFKKHLASASHLLITGKIISLEASRAVLSFARRSSTVTIDLATSQPTFDWVQAVQRFGASCTTIAEARLRSDLVVLLGCDDLLTGFPCLLHQLKPIAAQEKPRRLMLLGDFDEKAQASIAVDQLGFCESQILTVSPGDLLSFFRACQSTVPASPSDPFEALADTLSVALEAAAYPVIAFATNAELPNGAKVYSSMIEWIRQIAATKRVHLLPLSSSTAMFTQVCTWQTGFPGRISLSNSAAQYDPWLNTEAKFKSLPHRSALVLDVNESPSNCEVTIHEMSDGNLRELESVTLARPAIDTASTLLKSDGSIMLRLGEGNMPMTVSRLFDLM